MLDCIDPGIKTICKTEEVCVLEKLLTQEQQNIILSASEENAKLSQEILAHAVSLRDTFGKHGIEYDTKIFNVLEFVQLLQCDLNWLLGDLVKHHATLRGNLYGRILVLTIYESCKKFPTLLGPKFRKEFIKRLGWKDDQDLKEIHSNFSKLFDRCTVEFKNVRHGIIGHWDCDPDIRIELLKQANAQAVADLVIAMLKPLRELQEVLLSYVRYIMKGQ